MATQQLQRTMIIDPKSEAEVLLLMVSEDPAFVHQLRLVM